MLFMKFSRHEYWSGLPGPSPVGHILSELSTMACPSRVALHGIAHSFIELDKAVVHVIRLVSFLWLHFQSVWPIMVKVSRLLEDSWSEKLTEVEIRSCSDGLVHAQFSSVTQLCPTLCDPMNCSTPGFPVHHKLPEFTQTHVHQVGDAIQPSHHVSSPSPPALNLSQHQGLFKWVSSLREVTKLLEFQFQYQSFQRTPRTDLL